MWVHLKRRKVRLGVNVDHVATLRQQRKGEHPSPAWAAHLAQEAGCDGIVFHLREDRRHIQDKDLPLIRRSVQVPLNLEMAAHPEIVKIACKFKPDQATLVPERRQELTTEGGLNLLRRTKTLIQAVEKLKAAQIKVSLFVDPDPKQIEAAAELGVPMVEIHTGEYARGRWRSLNRVQKAAQLAAAKGMLVAAGHGLDYRNVQPVAEIPQVEELNIGYSIVVRALEVGLYQAVREMKKVIREGIEKVEKSGQDQLE